jgi:hypothetical protein
MEAPDIVFPGQTLGLREDGGWVDALQAAWTHSTAGSRSGWEQLLTLAREARPRGGGDWAEALQTAESKCGYPTSPFPPADPHPDPGTEAYQDTLARCAPDETWRQRVQELAGKIGSGEFTRLTAHLYRSAIQSGIGSLNRKSPNRDLLQALLWCVAAVPEPGMIDAARQLAAWSVEHNTAQAKTIGLALAFTTSEHAAAALRMLETAAKRPSPRTRFGRFASHAEHKAGISPEESAEQFIPTFGLDARGVLKKSFQEYGAVELRVEGTKAALRFYGPTGKEVASVPAALKREQGPELQELRAAAKGLSQLLVTQRERIDSLLLAQRTWDFAQWRTRYLEHPVVGTLARRLIWQVNGVPVVFGEQGPTDVRGAGVPVSPDAQVHLWHPLDHPAEEVRAWRERLEALNLTQPFKQAYREIYLLTDAERRTATYSNRFAGHILRQSQFRALAPLRKWQAPFLGGWDSGDEGVAKRDLPEHWRVEFWVTAAGEEYGESGGVRFISTDQVRFYRGTDAAPAPLEQVPALLFSEALRDVDLFVGVASVGNDPTWQDGGPEGRHREYWQNFAFGELGPSALTRRAVLERLVPKLKMAGVCSFDERFLVVRGQKRTYRIHLGSGNILMEPNGQYLCIVADRKASGTPQDVLLPFEGDALLSLILSKAFLLAEDWKIKDPTITRQIDAP